MEIRGNFILLSPEEIRYINPNAVDFVPTSDSSDPLDQYLAEVLYGFYDQLDTEMPADWQDVDGVAAVRIPCTKSLAEEIGERLIGFRPKTVQEKEEDREKLSAEARAKIENYRGNNFKQTDKRRRSHLRVVED